MSANSFQPEEPHQGLDKQLEDLGRQLGFQIEQPGRPHPRAQQKRGARRIEIVTLYHPCELGRHLSLLTIPGWELSWHAIRLPSGGDALDPASLHLIKRADLVLFLLSIDAVEALYREGALLTWFKDEQPMVVLVSLRPLHWRCPFPTLDLVPSQPLVVWSIRDEGCARVASVIDRVLDGLKTCLEADDEEHGS